MVAVESTPEMVAGVYATLAKNQAVRETIGTQGRQPLQGLCVIRGVDNVHAVKVVDPGQMSNRDIHL